MSMFDKNISKEKLDSLEFAEDARETEWVHPSFGLQLFHGKADWSLIHPCPQQSSEDKEIGDNYIIKLEKFLRTNLDPNEVDRTSIIPDNVVKGLGELKAFAMKVPQEYGGLGLSQVNYSRVMEMIASYCGSTCVFLSAHQSIGVPQPLKLFGTKEQKEKYFPMFAKGAISAFALTEVEAGSDPRNMSTTATPTEDGNHFLINGEKLWCTNGLVADVIVVMCVTPPKMIKGKERKQITAFILDMDTPGIDKTHRCHFMGLHGIQNGLISFKDVKVPKENIILGEGEGLKLALTTLNTGRLTLPAGSAGVSKWCLKVARKWSIKRNQWGASIGDHESIATKLSYIASHTFAIEAMSTLASHMADDKKKDIRLEAAIAKYFCTLHSYIICDETLQIRGGQGYESSQSLKDRGMESWAVERVLRDIRINLIIEGTSEIMHLFIAREALDPHFSKGKILFGKASLGKKLKVVMDMNFGYLSLWFPKGSNVGDIDATLRGHIGYIEKTSRRLGRAIIHAMVRYQKKLEAKQTVLNRIVQIGVELFAMAAACSYADQVAKTEHGQENSIELANLFCLEAKKRIEAILKDGLDNHDTQKLSVAKNVLANKYEWLESGIIE